MRWSRCLVALIFVFTIAAAQVDAGHSRHSYVDGGQSMDGRYVVLPKLIMGEKPKNGPTPYHWEYQWKDTETGKTIIGRLEGLRSGSSNVFDPVGSHIFVAPDGQTFALWTPQVNMQATSKNPGEPGTEAYRNYEGFSRRLVIYKKTGEVIKRFDLKDFLNNNDWQWFHHHQRQMYWLVDYPGLHTRSSPRPFYALYQISPDYTVLEFQIGANTEATHKAKQRGVTPPNPRTVRVRLTDGQMLGVDIKLSDILKNPVRPFVGRLSDKSRPQRNFQPSLDPVRQPGRFVVEEEKEEEQTQPISVEAVTVAKVTTADAKLESKPDDRAALVGTWAVKVFEDDGRDRLGRLGASPAKGDRPARVAKLVFTEDACWVLRGDGKRESRAGLANAAWKSVQLNPATSPKSVDITGFSGKEGDKKKTYLGIYELNGSTLKICWCEQGSKRPTEMKSDGANNLFVCEKVSPTPQKPDTSP